LVVRLELDDAASYAVKQKGDSNQIGGNLVNASAEKGSG
jgi:hypothetical protein